MKEIKTEKCIIQLYAKKLTLNLIMQLQMIPDDVSDVSLTTKVINQQHFAHVKKMFNC